MGAAITQRPFFPQGPDSTGPPARAIIWVKFGLAMLPVGCSGGGRQTRLTDNPASQRCLKAPWQPSSPQCNGPTGNEVFGISIMPPIWGWDVN